MEVSTVIECMISVNSKLVNVGALNNLIGLYFFSFVMETLRFGDGWCYQNVSFSSYKTQKMEMFGELKVSVTHLGVKNCEINVVIVFCYFLW